MAVDRTLRLNSLLKEVLSEVIRQDVKNPKVSTLITVMRVSITKDLRHAKVYVSIIGDEKEREETMKALRSARGFIAVTASKKVVMHHFPELKFLYDDSVEKHIRIETLLQEVNDEREHRNPEAEG